MNREKEIELIRRCLDLERAGSPYMSQDEMLIPAAHYADPERFERERDICFRRSLNVVGLSTMIPSAGDFMTLSIVGTPALLVRGDDGRARAFINVCRHRGATVEICASGHKNRFVCPYHAWTYGRDGKLCHVRHAEGFPSLKMAETSLGELSCLEGAGLLWVCPDPKVRHDKFDGPTQELIDELTEVLGPEPTLFESSTRDWKTNYKLIVDGGLESYHFRTAHRNTIGPYFGDTTSIYEMMGDHCRSVLPRRSIIELDGKPTSEWSLRDHAHLLYTVHPNASILIQRRHFEMVLLDPIKVTTTRIQIATVGRSPGSDGYSRKARDFLQRNHAFTMQTLTEDFELAEQIQRGIRAGANEHFRFGRFEGALTEWHRRLAERLAKG